MSLTEGKTASRYRPDIDGLRAVAIVAVIINHFNERLLPSGYLGVDIFFVISGFVITSSLSTHAKDSFADFILGFYARRVKRLLPALIVFVLISAFLICLFDPDPGVSLRTGTASLFGLSNLFLLQQAVDYFAESTELNIFTHTWSLGVEEQFYLVFPFLIWLSGFGRARIGGQRKLFLLIAPLALISWLAFQWLNGHEQPASAFFLMPARFWELAAGCLIVLLLQRARLKALLQRLPPLPVLGLLVATLFSSHLPYTTVRVTTLVVLLTSLLIASLRAGTAGQALLCRPAMVSLGLISYSLYLWHWTVLCLSRWTIGIHLWTAPFQVALMLALAIASHRWLEGPLRRARWSKLAWRTIAYGGVALLGATGLMAGMAKAAGFLSLDRRYSPALFTDNRDTVDAQPGQDRQSLCSAGNRVTQDLFDRCLGSGAGSSVKPKVIILGDSHAGHYVNAIVKALPDMDVRNFNVGWACGVIDKRDIGIHELSGLVNCADYIDLVDGMLAKVVQAGDLLIVGHRWQEKRRFPHQAEALERLALKTAQRQAHLILLDDVGELKTTNPLFCVRSPWRPFPPASCDRTLASIHREQAELDRISRKAVGINPNGFYLSLRTLYCETTASCGAYLGKQLVYADGNHLTYQASQIGASAIAARVRGMLAHPKPWPSSP
ncbi:acyltransferase family protein [Cyanobium sp. N.Huapi 1H5]|uniref:acyltransferase family protein n=1 Tax=Cyanobium sp. N.Huapi 1H5 TaxID=2823719 RepID=UPI0020CF46F8|nr:acyltransferase family protein [Cyanobium sp. N.Huapi 1H5]